jgi:Tol biopolymer transport system component
MKRLLVIAAALIAVPSATGTAGNGPILLSRYTDVYRGIIDLYSVRPDGSQLSPLKASLLISALSPDATRIALVTSGGGTSRDILVMNVDGSGLRKLASYDPPANSSGTIRALIWFPDNVRLAYQLPTYPRDEFRVVDVRSGEQVPVPVYDEGVPQVVRPEQWSPEATEFAYETPVPNLPSGYPQVRVKSLATGAIRTVADAGRHPVWSPDGRWIAYISTGSVYVAPRDGGQPVLVGEATSAPVKSVDNLFWSPDSSTLAFSASTSQRPEPKNGWAVTNGVFLARPDGSAQTLVRDHASVGGWSPAGDALLVYPTYSDPGYYPPYLVGDEWPVTGVYFMRPDGRCLTLAASGRALAWLPGDSPPRDFRCVDLALAMTAPKVSGLRGIQYMLRVANEGTDVATDVELTQRFNLAFHAVSLPKGCADTGDSITCRVARLEPGASVEFAPLVRPSGLTPVIGSATVQSVDHDSDPKSNSGSTSTRIFPCWIAGSDFEDTLTGTNAGEQICARAGDDKVYGLGGNDTIDAGLGSDTVYPGAGRDRVKAGEGRDTVYARDGERDVITCGRGFDFVVADRLDAIGRDCDVVARR